MSKFYNVDKNKDYISQGAIETQLYPAKQQFKPKVLGLKLREKIAKDLVLHFIVFWVGFVTWTSVSLTKIPMILPLGTIMWVAGWLSILMMPDKSYEIARKTRTTITTYTLTLLGWRLIVYILTGTPLALWEKALSMSLPASFTSAFLGFMTMAFVVAMFTIFIQYLGYIFQLFLFYKSRKKINDQIKIYTKRSE